VAVERHGQLCLVSGRPGPQDFWAYWRTALEVQFYFSGSVSWLRGLIQSSFTRLSQLRTIPTCIM